MSSHHVVCVTYHGCWKILSNMWGPASQSLFSESLAEKTEDFGSSALSLCLLWTSLCLEGPWQPALRGFRKTIANVFFTWKSCCHFASNFCANTSFSQPGSLEQALIHLGLRFESFISTFTMDEMLLLISNSLFAHYFKIYLKELLSLSLTHTQGNHSPNGCNNQGYARLNSEARNIIWVAHVGGRGLNTWQSSHAFLKQ